MSLLEQVWQRHLVGLDIGTAGIKAVEIQGKKEPRLFAYNRVPLPWGTISWEGQIEDSQAVVDALEVLFKTTSFSTRRVAIGATGNSIITKRIALPKMGISELNDQLYWEAEQYIPFDINEVNLDYAILGDAHPGGATEPMMDLLLVAAKKDYINSLTNLVKEAGLNPAIIDVQAFALGNVFEFNYGHLISAQSSAAHVILDFGAGSTKLSIVERDKTTFTREIRKCGSGCTIRISEQTSLSMEQSEEAKLVHSQDPGLAPIIKAYVQEWVEEIIRSLDYYTSQNPDYAFEGIYLCGGASRTSGLLETLQQKMPAPVSMLNPIQNIAGSGKKMNSQAIEELSYLGAVAIGLSLRRVGDS